MGKKEHRIDRCGKTESYEGIRDGIKEICKITSTIFNTDNRTQDIAEVNVFY